LGTATSPTRGPTSKLSMIRARIFDLRQRLIDGGES
jgi:hypothetical protein